MCSWLMLGKITFTVKTLLLFSSFFQLKHFSFFWGGVGGGAHFGVYVFYEAKSGQTNSYFTRQIETYLIFNAQSTTKVVYCQSDMWVWGCFFTRKQQRMRLTSR